MRCSSRCLRLRPIAQDGSEIARYQEEQSGMPPEQLKALQQFDSEGQLTTPFGMELREGEAHR